MLRRLLLVVAPVALLALLELVAALLDWAPSRRFFAAEGELSSHYVPQEDSPWGPVTELFPGVRFEVPKPAGVRRVFCVGASTVRGFPFDPLVSFPDRLRAGLAPWIAPDSLELFTCAANGRNAAAVADLVEELVQYQPDALLVYTGQNELHSWNRGLLQRPRLRELRRWCSRWRLGRLLLGAPQGGWNREQDAPGDEPPAAHAPHDIGGLQVVFPSPLPRALWHEAEHLYAQSLRRIVAAATEHDVPVLLCQLVSNLADFPPTLTVLDADGGDAEAAALWQQAVDVLEEARPASAGRLPLAEVDLHGVDAPAVERSLALLRQATEQAPDAAGLQFLRGRCEQRLGHLTAAQEAFQRAADHDAHPVRAHASLKAQVREVAEHTAALLVDPGPAFAADGPPGSALFLDNVHPTFEGQRRLAAAFLPALSEVGLLQPGAESKVDLDPPALRAHGATLARKIARLGLLSLEGSARARGTHIRWGIRRSFQVAVEMDPSCVEARFGEALVELAYDLAPDPIATLRECVRSSPALLPSAARLQAAHAGWRALLAPLASKAAPDG